MVNQEQLKAFENLKNGDLKLKSYVRSYPEEKFNFGPSPLCYWSKPLAETFRQILNYDFVNKEGVYLELGSFFGAGSTQNVLQHTAMKCLCLDNFAIPSNWWQVNKGPGHIKPASAIPRLPLRQMPFFNGQGTHLDHFMNNTWEYRDRITPIQCTIEREVLEAIYEAGIVPDLVFIDDDHAFEPLLWRLYFIAEYWPDAVVVCDDYDKKNWGGVVQAIDEALEKEVYNRERSECFGRLFMLRN